MSEPNYSVRISLLKCLDKSPAHAKAFIDGSKNDPTLGLRLGTGGHALLFGTPEVVVFKGGVLKTEKVKKPRKKPGEDPVETPEPSIVRFASHDPLVVEVSLTEKGLDGCEVSSKDYDDHRRGALWEHFEARHAGKVILRQSEHDLAAGMVRALHASADAAPLIFAPGTMHEQKLEWQRDGRRCSGTLDALGPDAVIDLKCVTDASPRAFPYQARKYGWHAQAIWYCDACELAGLGSRVPYLVAVESQPPHNVQVYRLTDADIRDGRRLYESWFAKLLECETAGYWPGYHDGILPLNVLNQPVVLEEDPWLADDEGGDSGDEINSAA